MSSSSPSPSLRTLFLLVLIVFVFSAFCLPAQQKQEESQTSSESSDAPVKKATGRSESKEMQEPPAKPEPEPVVTHHQIRVGSRALTYTATTGRLPIKNVDGETEAYIFFIAYTLDNPPGGAGKRPLTFSFNGGPGSSSVWLHLGAIGPRRVRMQPEGFMPAPPYQLEDNQYTWLDQTDLVFIDPVGTGYSRPAKKELGKKFWSLKGDIASVGEFIRLYLSRYQRWGSPLFLAGESYGTTRAAGLSGYLIEHGIAFNGIVLVSSVLNFQTLEFAKGNDLPYILYLPTYTSTAWYHKKLPADLQKQPLQQVLRQAEEFASGEYTLALPQGDRMTPEQRKKVVAALARFTGLSPEYLEESNLRVEHEHFTKELLRDQNRTVGRLDSRFTGLDLSGVSETPDFDPSMAAIRPPYTAMFNNYVREDLGYKSDLEYFILGGFFKSWEWGNAGEGFPDVSEALRSAFAKNNYMKLFVANGYYDLATPFYATQYTLNHLNLDPSLRKNVTLGYYEAGHMMYIRQDSLEKLHADISKFLSSSSNLQ